MSKACLSLIVAGALYAESDIFELQKTLMEATEIATMAKMNVDYVPSVVTVIKGEKLLRLGAKTVYDALEMLPGIQMQINQLGEVITVVRGFKNPNAQLTEKIKVMIDGNSVNSETFGTAGYIMNFPVHLIERIEVLRGPGSTVYGSGAFYGAVNIITKISKEGDCGEVFLGGGSWAYKSAGVVKCVKAGDLSIAFDAYYKASDKALALDPSYTDAGSLRPFSREYESDEDFDDVGVGVVIKNGRWSLNNRFKKSHNGNFYGTEERLSPVANTGQTNQYFSSKLVYKDKIDENSVELSLGFRDYAYQMYDRTRDYTYQAGKLPGYDYDFTHRERVGESTVYAEAICKFKPIERHSISLDAVATYTAIRENYIWSSLEDYVFANSTNEKYNEEPVLKYPYNNEFLKKGTNRKSFGLSMEDLYEVTPNIDFVVGARADKLSDAKMQLNFRGGVVARWLDNSVITKLIYSTGHRAPTLTEQYANAHINFRAGDDYIKPEEIREYEAVIIYKPGSEHYLSVTGYYAELNNVIDIEEFLETTIGHINYPKRTSKGVEIEYAYTPNSKLEWHLNASYNKTSYINTDNGVAQEMPDVSPVMYKSWVIYRPSKELILSAKYLSQSKTYQNLSWSRDTTIPGQQRVDMSATYEFSKALSTSFSLYNAQNKLQRMPSYFYRNTIGRNDGMIREGRNFIAELRYKF